LAAQWRGLQAEHQWRFTPPLQIMRALAQALCEFKAAGGRTARLLHYRRLAERLEQGMARLGFLPLIASAHRAPIIISFAPRPGLAYDIGKLNGFLAARGIEIYPSKHWRADSFRVGVIGELESEDIDLLLAAFQAFIEDSSKQRQEDRMPCP
jgi:2-aminoethylphosphonate-pyruvate transaminase